MEINQVTGEIIGAAIRVHSSLGPGLLESTYRSCLHHELVLRGLEVRAEWPVPVAYRGLQIDVGYRVDLLVEDRVLVELKAVERTLVIHKAQLLSYLRLSNRPMGLLINFNVVRLRHGIRRISNQLARGLRRGTW